MRNLVTLKMLTCYPGAMEFEVAQDGDRWVLLSLLPVRASAWDRQTYPDCKYAAFINGNDVEKMVQLLLRTCRKKSWSSKLPMRL